jgi:cytochrome c-type biogenesis protein CcmE
MKKLYSFLLVLVLLFPFCQFSMAQTSVTISEARKDDNHDLIPDYSVSGDTLMVTGVITSPSLSSSSATFFIQDATGGIEVFYYGALPTTNFTMGDSVFVIGKIAQYHGLDEIEPLTIDSTNLGLLKHNAVMPMPMHVSLHEYVMNSESYEGMLIQIDTVFKASGTWPSTSGSLYFTNKGNTDTAQVYVNAATNIGGTTEPMYPVNVVGIGSQYSSGTTVYDDGYEILPRSKTDIKNSYLMSISEARKDDNHDLIPDYSVSGDTLMITGVITSPSLSSTSVTFFIQDATGGIEVFYYGSLPTTNFTMGDSVFVIGKIAQYHGLDEIEPLTIDSTNLGLLKHNAVMPMPMHVSLHQYAMNSENYEGVLIAIVDTLYKALGTWPGASSGASIFLTNLGSTDTAQMYINAATKIGGTTEPLYPVSLVGIGSQYSSSTTVYDDGYEIIPRDSADIKSIIITAIDKGQNRIYTYNLYQNYPNPFNPTTLIRFEVPSAQKVQLLVYNVLGQKVATLYNSIAPEGITNVNFDASNLASGVYIYSIRTASFTTSKKLMLLK